MHGAEVYTVIATWNGEAWIRNALQSLRNSILPVKTVVVDNASSDATRAIVRGEFPEVFCIELPINQGFGVATNHGIRHALEHGADHVLLLNQDAMIFPDTISELMTVMSASPDIGIASPLHLVPAATKLEPLFHSFIASHVELVSDCLLGRMRGAYDIEFVNAAVWLVRRRVFERVGGFDPVFFMYGEDNDFCARVRYHGFRVCLVPRSRACHAGGSLPGVHETFQRSCLRATSRTIHYVKRPGHCFALSCLSYLIVWLKQVVVLVMNASFREVAANCIGLCRAYAHLHMIRKHHQRCCTTGQVWLDF